jgi:hypothetical protein
MSERDIYKEAEGVVTETRFVGGTEKLFRISRFPGSARSYLWWRYVSGMVKL